MSSSDSATFWLIGVPNAASSGSTRSNKNTDKDLVEEAKLTRRQLDMSINKYAKLSDFPIPKLKVGTLDSLMQLSDDLVKIDQQMEAAVLKIARNYTDLKTNDKLLVDESMSRGCCVLCVVSHRVCPRVHYGFAFASTCAVEYSSV